MQPEFHFLMNSVEVHTKDIDDVGM